MDPERAPPAAAASPAWQLAARTVLAIAVIGMGGWILFDFLPALAWAAVLAFAVWPSYQRLLGLLPRHGDRMVGPTLATVLIGTVIIGPLVLLLIALAREVHVVIEFIAATRHYGMPTPEWLHQLPMVGPTLADWWANHLTDPALAEELFGRIDMVVLSESARHYGGEVVHRLVILSVHAADPVLPVSRRQPARRTAARPQRSLDRSARRTHRPPHDRGGARHGYRTGAGRLGRRYPARRRLFRGQPALSRPGRRADRGCRNRSRSPHRWSTALAGLYLFAVGNTLGAFFVIAFGSAVVFVADHFVRPVVIGGAARLPFLLVLLGILRGLETMGILGLFLGPAVMAALVALWREWTEPEPVTETVRAAPQRRIANVRSGRARKV